ncbi:hypothetical protein [Sediminibacterium sp.]|uniref:hypothetical protein n=1 Tax=Sediminibacterium sp. TaxID=1917865 RepID=UPI002734FF12|nr:hypothetical protein [Sediminibacterium sp.]MDP3393001.1 hypothetical protein [Sediminibacterium sp.]MDP3567207.1 hypothetical protein [Sediminibacterium sp.]
MKKLLFYLALLLIVKSNIVFSQFHEEECIYGNCKNGFGILAIKGNKFVNSPAPFHVKNIVINDPGTYYYYYKVGQFEKKELNGMGYKLSVPGSFNAQGSHAWLINMVKQNLIDSIASSCIWYEKGTYSNGLLNGKGFQMMKEVFITEADFVAGKTKGSSYSIRSSRNGFFKVDKDLKTNKYKILVGRQLYGTINNNFCTDCQETEYTGNIQGTSIARRMNLDFLNGWIVKDYGVDAKSGYLKNVDPFRVLYVGNVELFRIPTVEQSLNVKEVILANGAKYTGEVDEKGRPFGFGILQLYDSGSKWFYEGFVDNEKPEGWGIIRLEDDQYEDLNVIMGGFFVNGIIRNGALIKPEGVNEKVLISFRGSDDKSIKIYSEIFKDIVNGYYSKSIFSFDEKLKRWFIKREEFGEKVNGYPKDVWVSLGKTIAETRKQRIVTNGFIDSKDLTIGDVVVVNGMASLVMSVSGSIYFKLKNNTTITMLSGSKVQLSKHNSSAFIQTCNKCKGSGMESFTYQRPPTEKVIVNTRYETEVLDYTTWRKTITETKTYIQTYPTEQRSRPCTECNAKGTSHDVNEIVE